MNESVEEVEQRTSGEDHKHDWQVPYGWSAKDTAFRYCAHLGCNATGVHI